MSSIDFKPVLVRPATRADADAIAGMARQLLLYEHSLERSMGDLTEWAGSSREILKQMSRPNLCFFVAESDGQIAGYIKVMIVGTRLSMDELGFGRWVIDLIDRAGRGIFNILLRRPRSNIEQTGGYIAGLFVSPDVRRSGMGGELVKAAEAWLRDHGVPTCDLHVLSANEEARLFWVARGYRPLSIGLRKPL